MAKFKKFKKIYTPEQKHTYYSKVLGDKNATKQSRDIAAEWLEGYDSPDVSYKKLIQNFQWHNLIDSKTEYSSKDYENLVKVTNAKYNARVRGMKTKLYYLSKQKSNIPE